MEHSKLGRKVLFNLFAELHHLKETKRFLIAVGLKSRWADLMRFNWYFPLLNPKTSKAQSPVASPNNGFSLFVGTELTYKLPPLPQTIHLQNRGYYKSDFSTQLISRRWH